MTSVWNAVNLHVTCLKCERKQKKSGCTLKCVQELVIQLDGAPSTRENKEIKSTIQAPEMFMEGARISNGTFQGTSQNHHWTANGVRRALHSSTNRKTRQHQGRCTYLLGSVTFWLHDQRTNHKYHRWSVCFPLRPPE